MTPATAISRRQADPTASVAAFTREAPEAAEPGNGEPGLAAYFRDITAIDVMTRDEELAAAVRIAERRTTYWRTVLDDSPAADGVCELARALLPGPDGVAALVCAYRRSRAGRGGVADETVRAQLAAALAEADLDGRIADRMLAELAKLAAGREAPGVGPSDLNRQSLLDHVSRVRTAHRALCDAKNAFVQANLRLVVRIARRFRHCRLPLADLIQEGNLGLMKAVDRFDHRKGFRFCSYAVWWIRQAIGRSIADKARMVRLPVHTVVAYNKVLRTRHQFEAVHGRKPDEAEVAALAGVSAGLLERMRHSFEDAVSLVQPLSGTGLTLLDVLEDSRVPRAAHVIDQALLASSLPAAFAALSPMEADVLRRRLGIDDDRERTLREIGETYSLSRERIRQVQEQALEKLRDEFRRRKLM